MITFVGSFLTRKANIHLMNVTIELPITELNARLSFTLGETTLKIFPRQRASGESPGSISYEPHSLKEP